jgi:hypothetical protein
MNLQRTATWTGIPLLLAHKRGQQWRDQLSAAANVYWPLWITKLIGPVDDPAGDWAIVVRGMATRPWTHANHLKPSSRDGRFALAERNGQNLYHY